MKGGRSASLLRPGSAGASPSQYAGTPGIICVDVIRLNGYYSFVASQVSKNKRDEKPLPRRSPELAAFLNIQRTADELMAAVAQLLKPAKLSPTQYNVLRILRAAGEEGLPCGKIGDRLLTREPDLTRLLDRLAKRALIERLRDSGDRRVVRGKITRSGREVLGGLDQKVLDLHKKQLGHLGREQLAALGRLLDQVRQRT
jgi:DNA-binding MarR family transcriptional regulator